MITIKEKVLLVAPSPDFLKDHQIKLKTDFDLQVATNSDAAIFLCREWNPGLCLVDGDAFADYLHSMIIASSGGFIILSKSNNPHKEEHCFRMGADHFIPLPFDYKQLHMRMLALVRRLKAHRPEKQLGPPYVKDELPQILLVGTLRIFPNDFLVKRNDELVNVTPTQFRLLVTFATRRDQLLSRAWLKEAVWENAEISLRSIDAQISKLKKIVPELEQYLVNIYGKGYIFSLPREHAA